MTRKLAEPNEMERGREASGVVVRPLLAAGLTFVEHAAAERLTSQELAAWLKTWLVVPALMEMPATVCEPAVGTVALGTSVSGAWAAGTDARLARIVAAARTRVTATLGALLATPVDNRFLSAAIFSGRVERMSGNRGASWRPRPLVTDRLSDVVLSLFASDVLSNREEYDACLCVCDFCGRVVLQAGQLSRTRCEEHEASLA